MNSNETNTLDEALSAIPDAVVELLDAGQPAQAAPAADTLLKDERGQISVLLMFGTLALVILAGLILNTAKMTSRKIEMQGAADAAAVSTGAWAARGMNLIAFNNCGMADILSVVVIIHSAWMTTQIMGSIVLPAMIAAFSAGLPWTAGIVAYLSGWETTFWNSIQRTLWQTLDNAIAKAHSGFGWKILGFADELNQILKIGAGPLAAAQGHYFSRLNGARLAIVFPGKGITDAGGGGGGGGAGDGSGNNDGGITGVVPVPWLPLIRGKSELIAQRGLDCPWPALSAIPVVTFLAAPLSAIPATILYYAMNAANWATLGAFSAGGNNNPGNAAGLEHFIKNPDQAMEIINADHDGANQQNIPNYGLAQYLNANPDKKQQYTRPPDANNATEWIDYDAFVADCAANPQLAAEVAASMQEREANEAAQQAMGGGGGGGGGGNGDLLPLQWQSADERPRPMVLTNEPSGFTERDKYEEDPEQDMKEIYKYLQYLAIATQRMDASPIAATQMDNPRLGNAPWGWITYAQANTYNPTKWDMFSQDWRTKMVKAKLLNEKLSAIPVFGGENSSDIVNTH